MPGEGVLLYLGEEAMRALGAIRPESTRRMFFGLQPAAIAARIRAAAAAAGLGDGFTDHAARDGMAVDLVRDGTELPAVMTSGRWKSPPMGAAAGRGGHYHIKGSRLRPRLVLIS